jgi:hypothetical protein
VTPIVIPPFYGPKRLGERRLGIDGRRQIAVTAYCVHRFFDAALDGQAISHLEIPSAVYPEIEVRDASR